jgi:hypothetical protein
MLEVHEDVVHRGWFRTRWLFDPARHRLSHGAQSYYEVRADPAESECTRYVLLSVRGGGLLLGRMEPSMSTAQIGT